MLAGSTDGKAVAEMSDAPAPHIQLTEGTKAVINDPGLVATARSAEAAFGERLRLTAGRTRPSEDFSEFAGPACRRMMFNIGVSSRKCGRRPQERNATGGQSFAAISHRWPKPTILTRCHRHDACVLSAFDQHARGK